MRVFAACFGIILSLVFVSIVDATAQCSMRGVVLAGPAGNSCGLVLATPGGGIFSLSENNYGLQPGDEILFGLSNADESASCPYGDEVSLNCMQLLESAGGNPCVADFSQIALSTGSLERIFYPELSAPGIYSYLWDLGDGTISTEAQPVHQFSEAGSYQVCLTTISPDNCTANECQTITVQPDEPGDCGVLLEVSGNGHAFSAAAYNLIQPGAPFESIEWMAYPGALPLGESIGFGFSAAEGAPVEEICLNYTIAYPDGSNCSGEICRNLAPADDCVDPQLVDPQANCPVDSDPVCGCDGITYASACEAISQYGVISYTPGPCTTNSGPPGECHAFFGFEKSADFVANAWNASTGDYTEVLWELNGAVAGTEETILFDSPEAGIQVLCLTVSGGSGACSSTYCREVFLGPDEDLCQFTDCVWPGDVDGSGQANMYDVLQIGLGYGVAGNYRPDATIQWQGQLAPDWNMLSTAGVDYKHLDADGSGQVSETDLFAIDLNYAPTFSGNQIPVASAPLLYIAFHQDTIVFGPDSPEEVTISADILLGTAGTPAQDVYGMAFSLIYPQQDVVLPHSATFSPVANGFLGLSGELLDFQQDLYNFKRLDAAVSRKDGASRSGFSVVGTADFIVVSDIIGGRSEDVVEFALTVENARILNDEGEPLEYNLPSSTAILYIINEMSTAVVEPELTEQWVLQPNPASNEVLIQAEDLKVTALTVSTLAGVELYRSTSFTGQVELPIAEWSPGVYLVELTAEEGRSVKRLVICE